MSRSAPAFWQSRSVAAVALLPLAVLFGLLSAIRRQLFRFGVLRPVRLPVPVVVVGNIAVGGSGKTPVVQWLVERLRAAGFTPGIVSRGYGGRVQGVAIVEPGGDPAVFGDEPVLLADTARCPVAVGADRPAAALELLRVHPQCDVVISDDGLQHYRLARDVEIVVVDERTLGNRWLLPAGPLREGIGRLASVDALLVHGPLSSALRRRVGDRPLFDMRLEGDTFRALRDPDLRCDASAFAGRTVHAVAGIGRPERFFAQLSAMGLDVVGHAFPDHHPFVPADLAFAPGEPKLLTSKDAVKCRSFAPADAWEFPVEARVAAGAAERILEKLTHGRPAA